MRLTPLCAPDGMTNAGGDAARFAGVGRRYTPTGRLEGFHAVQAHERQDDGLVHNHAWAASDNAEADGATDQREAGGAYFGTMPISRGKSSTTTFTRPLNATQVHDHRDDGLVHNHAWAFSSK